MEGSVEYVVVEIEKGGKGSGHFRHRGRPGQRGGSLRREQVGGDGGGVDDVRKEQLVRTLEKIGKIAAEGRDRGVGKLVETVGWAAEWIAKTMSANVAGAALDSLVEQYRRIGQDEEWIETLVEHATKAHEPHSRELHIDPGQKGARCLSLGPGACKQIYGLEDSKGKRAVYKLAIGEWAGLRDQPGGTEPAREVAVSRIADMLGLTGDAEGYSGWRVVRSDFMNDGVEGSVSEWVEHDNEGDSLSVESLSDDIVKEMAIFDILVGNPDRHPWNIMVDTDGKVVAIDHGIALTDRGRGYAITEVERRVRDSVPLTDRERSMARILLEHRDELYALAEEVDLPSEVMDQVLERAKLVQGCATWGELSQGLQ